jgi:hypothetical protein
MLDPYEQIQQQHGNGGYWCQGDAVYVQAEDAAIAIDLYRHKLSQGAIAVTTHLPSVDAARVRQLQDDWRVQVALRLQYGVPKLQGMAAAQEAIAQLDDIEILRFALLVAAETFCTVEDWLGQASTRNAAYDSLHRLRRVFGGLGLNPVSSKESPLEWRGSLVEGLEQVGCRMGYDGRLRRVLPGQPNHEFAKGETLAEALGQSPAEEPWDGTDF